MKKLRIATFAVIAGLLVMHCSSLPKKNPSQQVAAILEREGDKIDSKTREEIAQTVMELSEEYGLDPMLILAVIKVESRFELKARSHRGALGLMQVRPIVVREIADDLGIDPRNSRQLAIDHAFNIRVGVHYLVTLLNKFGGDVRKALMAYNRGPTIVARLYKYRPVPESGYQGKVLREYANYSF
jgi:soluble lytic murein transglycosylase